MIVGIYFHLDCCAFGRNLERQIASWHTMAEPTLRDMYRWSGGSHSPPTTLPGDASQSTAPTSASGRGLQVTAAPQPNDDSESSSDESHWYRSGSKYPTPHQQTQQYSNSPQAPMSSRASSTRKRDNGENQPLQASQTSGARQQLSGGSQLPPVSRPPDDMPRHSGAPQSPAAASWPYEEGLRHTSGPESKILTLTSGQARPLSIDKSQYASIIQQTPPHQATGNSRHSDRYSSGGQAPATQLATSNTSRPYDDRHRYNVRTSNDKQRFSTASTLAQPASAHQPEDKQRRGSAYSATAPGGTADTVRSGVATTTFAPVSGPTVSARDQANDSNIPKKSTTSKSVAIDVNAISRDNAKAIEQTKLGPNSPVDLLIFRALLGKPSGNDPLPLSNIRQAAEALDEGRTPTSVKTFSRTSTGKSSITAQSKKKKKSRGSRFLPWFLHRGHDDSDYDTSVYYNLMRQETKTKHLYTLYDGLTYVCLIAQLIISAALIILGAVNGDYHIPVAILGAVTGLITGILSLIRGQGLPQRLMRYADGLRQVREHIEFTERELIAGVRTVTYGECVKLQIEYENVREDAMKNHPDTWTSWSSTTSSGTSKNGKGFDLEKGKE